MNKSAGDFCMCAWVSWLHSEAIWALVIPKYRSKILALPAASCSRIHYPLYSNFLVQHISMLLMPAVAVRVAARSFRRIGLWNLTCITLAKDISLSLLLPLPFPMEPDCQQNPHRVFAVFLLRDVNEILGNEISPKQNRHRCEHISRTSKQGTNRWPQHVQIPQLAVLLVASHCCTKITKEGKTNLSVDICRRHLCRSC